MENFIVGLVEKNVEAAIYEGKAWERELALRLPNGWVMHITDPEKLSEGLPLGENYTVLISPEDPYEIQYFPTQPAIVATDKWQGTVLDPHWHVPELTNARVSKFIVGEETVLIATPFGRLIMFPSQLEKYEVSAGGFLQWKGGWFVLRAVLDITI
jgi:hypothetical protein